ncbi:hypothetical protein D9M71_738910 [compost metagenome]
MAPPNTGSFSTSMTFCPCQAAVTAAASPAAPEPITSTSHSALWVWDIESLRKLNLWNTVPYFAFMAGSGKATIAGTAKNRSVTGQPAFEKKPAGGGRAKGNRGDAVYSSENG